MSSFSDDDDRGYDRGYDRDYDRGYDRDYDRGYDRGYDRDYGRDYSSQGYGGQSSYSQLVLNQLELL